MPCLETQFRIFISKIAFSLSVWWVGKIPLHTHIHRKTLSVSRTSIIVILTTVKKSSMKFQISNSSLKLKKKNQKKQSTLLTLPHHCHRSQSLISPSRFSLKRMEESNQYKYKPCVWMGGWVDGCILYIDLSIYDQQQRKKQKESRVEPI